MRKALALIALAIVWLAWPSTDCSDLTETECERAELITAGAID
jgi:hypothetical protein